MASNQIPVTAEPLISLATGAADGAGDFGAAIGLLQNTEARIRADLAAFIGNPAASPPVIGARNAYHAAKTAKTAATANRRSVESSARGFCASAVNLLKNFLGTQWNSLWQAVGFTNGSLAIPDDPLPMLGELRAYFIDNPTQENAPLNITAASCSARMDSVTAARAAAHQSALNLGDAMAARDAAQAALYRRMTGLRAELHQLLSDEDSRWYALGFDRPIDGWQPGPVEHLVLTPGGPGMVFVDWEDARRATRYRVLKQVTGTDPEPVEVTSTITDSEYLLTDLPTGATVQVTIVALNTAGEGVLPATASVVVP